MNILFPISHYAHTRVDSHYLVLHQLAKIKVFFCFPLPDRPYKNGPAKFFFHLEMKNIFFLTKIYAFPLEKFSVFCYFSI